jgi:excisionase family DNA binding protein
MERLLSVNETANLLNLSPWTIRAWLSKGKIQAVKLGRRVVFEQSEIERIVTLGKQNH